MTTPMDRRAFTTSLALAGTLATLPASAKPVGANDRIRVGFIGVGNRGDQVLDAFLTHKDCEVVAFCDLYEPYLAPANRKAGGKATLYHDYRKMLEDKSIDAVVVATPDHWHAMHCVDACKAEKDVYVEKPLSLTIGEGQRMVKVAQEKKRVTQVGLHRRSADYIMEAVKLIRDGVSAR